MSTVTQEEIVRLLLGQCRSADLWVDQWQRNKDPGSYRNVSLALGKIYGIYNVLVFMTQGFENLPDDVMGVLNKYHTIWEELKLPERN